MTFPADSENLFLVHGITSTENKTETTAGHEQVRGRPWTEVVLSESPSQSSPRHLNLTNVWLRILLQDKVTD